MIYRVNPVNPGLTLFCAPPCIILRPSSRPGVFLIGRLHDYDGRCVDPSLSFRVLSYPVCVSSPPAFSPLCGRSSSSRTSRRGRVRGLALPVPRSSYGQCCCCAANG